MPPKPNASVPNFVFAIHTHVEDNKRNYGIQYRDYGENGHQMVMVT